MMNKRNLVWSFFGLSTLGGIVSVYFLLFAYWMVAHPRYDSEAWRARYDERLAITMTDAIIWTGSVIWLFRNRYKEQTRTGDEA